MPRPEIGYNIQITKVNDRAGGAESLTINTAVPPDASAATIYARLKVMGYALQRRINVQCEAELRRQAEERAAAGRITSPGLRTPESLPDMPPNGDRPITDA